MCEEKTEAGVSAINNGVAHLWVHGAGTGQEFYTCFLRGDGLDWTTKQRTLLFGPGCEIGATWHNYDLIYPKIRTMMFNDLERTVFSGGIGQINGTYAIGHYSLKDAILEEMSMIPSEGLPLATIAGNAARRIGESNPIYAAGVTCFGALIMTGPTPSTSNAPQSEDINQVQVEFAPVRMVDGWAQLNFFLPESGIVDMSIFDVSGRKVASLSDGAMSAGSHELRWKH